MQASPQSTGERELFRISLSGVSSYALQVNWYQREALMYLEGEVQFKDDYWGTVEGLIYDFEQVSPVYLFKLYEAEQGKTGIMSLSPNSACYLGNGLFDGVFRAHIAPQSHPLFPRFIEHIDRSEDAEPAAHLKQGQDLLGELFRDGDVGRIPMTYLLSTLEDRVECERRQRFSPFTMNYQ